ncbi:MAG: D-alanyl-D-alanine carboxypeptidase [Clostridiales bacterium]|nr:D-alanyl-D-alanine carboxypeptidase [Clostridiales bacterium]
MKAFKKAAAGLLASVLLCTAALFCPLTLNGEGVRAEVSQPELNIPSLDEIECRSYCVYDKTADEIVISKEPNMQIYPASMTKVMTIQLGMDYLSPNDYLTVSDNAIDNTTSDSTLMGLYIGEQVRVSELYYGMMLPSGNDAANVVAEGVIDAFFEKYPAGGDEVGPDGINGDYFEEQMGMMTPDILYSYKLTAFALLMNYRAKELGCENTNFVNANGLHNDDHYTTAYELAKIMAKASENPDFCTVIGSATHIFESTNLHTEDGWSIVKNTNNLLNDPWLACRTKDGKDTHLTAFIGGKTGTTSAAGTGMVVYTVNENGHELFIAVCGIPDHAYQTRYVASVVAYGNLACWEKDPVTRVIGTTGDYRRFNSTKDELPQYDPLIVPGDELIDYISDPIEPGQTEVPDETEVVPDETEAGTEESGNTPSGKTEKGGKGTSSKDSELITFVKENLVLSGIVVALVTLIFVCIIALIVRGIRNSRKKKNRRKVRPFKGGDDYV